MAESAGWNYLHESLDGGRSDETVVGDDLDRALVLHARATVGYQIGHWEVFVGYDFLRIDPVNIQGPLAGVRLWF